MSKEEVKLYDKVRKVIKSCTTTEHIEVSRKLVNRVSIINTDMAVALNYRLNSKINKLKL